MNLTTKPKLIFGLAATLITAITASNVATAQQREVDYVVGENVFSCSTTKHRSIGSYDCRPAGDRTPRIKRLPFIDTQTGTKTLEEVPGSLNVLCDQYGCATISNQPGFPKGTMVGKGANGYFIIESGWYLGYDSNGHTTAYRGDVGPDRGDAPYEPLVNIAKYGTDACHDDAVNAIESKTGAPLEDYYMIRQILEECGLPSQ